MGWKAVSGAGGGFSGCSLYRTADQAVGNGAGRTAISWNAETFDTDTYHDNAVNPTRITVPSTNKYLITGNVSLDDMDDTADYVIDIRVNGSSLIARPHRAAHDDDPATAGVYFTVSFAHVASLSASDYVEITVFETSSAGAYTVDCNTAAETNVQVTKLG